MDPTSSSSYPPMSVERRKFLDYVIRMYAGQENDERFRDTGQIMVDLPGLEHFIINQYVYSPVHINVAQAWPRLLVSRTEGKSFLDMGTGTGISAIFVARHGTPLRVVATDISPIAAENCKANAKQYGLTEPFFRTYMGDVFGGIPHGETFDVMFWNFPWNAPDQNVEEILAERNIPITRERVFLLHAGLDLKYRGLRTFIEEGQGRLNPGGEILLGAGGPSRHDIIYGEAERLGLKIEILSAQEDVTIDNIGNQVSTFILYRLTK
jgi:SAM-dependent methyltransferase